LSKPHFDAAVVGGGPAGLMAAEILVQRGATVTVYDRMPSVGRKFLLAGRGGLNLTHSEDLERLIARYSTAAVRLRPAIEAFPPAALRAWCEELGQPTFVGSSGRVFPRAMKASPLLRAWLQRLNGAGVVFKPRHLWRGWDNDERMIFDNPDGRSTVTPQAAILALGGASWPRLGSDGGWAEVLSRGGISVTRLSPANCGFAVNWSEIFRGRFEGSPLKRIALSFGTLTIRGEAMITRAGIEGSAIYALSAPLAQAIASRREATLSVDLRPDTPRADLERRVAAPRGKQSTSTFLRKAVKLSPVAIALLQEVSRHTALSALAPTTLADLIKAVPLRLTATMPIARAISSAGGIAFDEIDEHFMLRRRPGVFVAGEMLDWDAPTGGYLLQACFATGAAAGRGAIRWLANQHELQAKSASFSAEPRGANP
jgi:uncharacterized flavoprotein (TIGR03862 family)